LLGIRIDLPDGEGPKVLKERVLQDLVGDGRIAVMVKVVADII
jgi:hypothetical protein